MTPEDLRTVADDLQYLARWGPEISDGEIRRGSSVLRRLLVEDVFGRAWRTIGKPKQPVLIAVDISGIAGPDNPAEIILALAAGAEYRGARIACIMLNKGPESPGELCPPLREDGYPGEREFTLSEFLSSPSGIIEGQWFNRREVIKYIANVRGGVHLSTKRKKAERALVARLGRIEKRISVFSTDGLLVELVAIGQALGSSNDARDLVEHVMKMT